MGMIQLGRNRNRLEDWQIFFESLETNQLMMQLDV
jgi:hypothetical protein